jgi:hypothetical protein
LLTGGKVNNYVLTRLAGIHAQLIAGYSAGSGLSSASKGSEREEFIDKFLSQVLPNPFRFGTGDATDKNGAKSGQLDVVIEFPFGPSLPIVGGTTSRLFLAETVAAVIEVKSNIQKQWNEAVSTAKQLYPLTRSFGTAMIMGKNFPKIPLFVAGFKGWKEVETLKDKIASTPEISGILVIDRGIFVSSPEFAGVAASGPWSLWALIACLHQATGFLKAVSTNPLEYAL